VRAEERAVTVDDDGDGAPPASAAAAAAAGAGSNPKDDVDAKWRATVELTRDSLFAARMVLSNQKAAVAVAEVELATARSNVKRAQDVEENLKQVLTHVTHAPFLKEPAFDDSLAAHRAKTALATIANHTRPCGNDYRHPHQVGINRLMEQWLSILRRFNIIGHVRALTAEGPQAVRASTFYRSKPHWIDVDAMLKMAKNIARIFKATPSTAPMLSEPCVRRQRVEKCVPCEEEANDQPIAMDRIADVLTKSVHGTSLLSFAVPKPVKTDGGGICTQGMEHDGEENKNTAQAVWVACTMHHQEHVFGMVVDDHIALLDYGLVRNSTLTRNALQLSAIMLPLSQALSDFLAAGDRD
jgi:hypothetical protein